MLCAALRYLTTVISLFMNIVVAHTPNTTDHPFSLVFKFVSDRMRAIRQDFVCQNQKTLLQIVQFQCIARFHILSEHECIGAVQEDFDPIQNMEKCTQTLLWLMQVYGVAPHLTSPVLCASSSVCLCAYLWACMCSHV